MQLPPKNYDAMVKRANPPSSVVKLSLIHI